MDFGLWTMVYGLSHIYEYTFRILLQHVNSTSVAGTLWTFSHLQMHISDFVADFCYRNFCGLSHIYKFPFQILF